MDRFKDVLSRYIPTIFLVVVALYFAYAIFVRSPEKTISRLAEMLNKNELEDSIELFDSGMKRGIHEFLERQKREDIALFGVDLLSVKDLCRALPIFSDMIEEVESLPTWNIKILEMKKDKTEAIAGCRILLTSGTGAGIAVERHADFYLVKSGLKWYIKRIEQK